MSMNKKEDESYNSEFMEAAKNVASILGIEADEASLERLAKEFRDNRDSGTMLTRKDLEKIFNIKIVPPEDIKEKALQSVITKKPKNFITTVNKVSTAAFNGIIGKQEVKPEKNIKTLISINFDEAQSQGITTSKHLTAYDREIHDAITSLYVDGGNEYITTNMIYQTITGSIGVKKGMSSKTADAISESVTKLMYNRIVIDATEEARAFNKDISKLSKDSPLLPAERVTAIINGQMIQTIHILKAPPLYEYSESKDQIYKVPIKLLKSPGRKDAESIVLEGYLRRRILAMQNGKAKNTILYDTIYKQIEIKSATPGALRKKKTIVRGKVRKFLDFMIKEGVVKGYEESSQGQEIYSISIEI